MIEFDSSILQRGEGGGGSSSSSEDGDEDEDDLAPSHGRNCLTGETALPFRELPCSLRKTALTEPHRFKVVEIIVPSMDVAEFPHDWKIMPSMDDSGPLIGYNDTGQNLYTNNAWDKEGFPLESTFTASHPNSKGQVQQSDWQSDDSGNSPNGGAYLITTGV